MADVNQTHQPVTKLEAVSDKTCFNFSFQLISSADEGVASSLGILRSTLLIVK